MGTLRDNLGDLGADALAFAREFVDGLAEMCADVPVVLGRTLPRALG